jgi:hypothetical protein
MTSGKIILNLAPITFSKSTVPIGWLPYVDEEDYEQLRERHRRTHLFRFDGRSNRIANVTIAPEAVPLGQVEKEAPLAENLLLAGQAVQASVLAWLRKNNRRVISRSKPIVFLGSTQRTKVLSTTLQNLNIVPIGGLEVATRFVMDTRIFVTPKEEKPNLGLLIDIRTSNVIDLPIADLAKRGLKLTGRYVCRRKEVKDDLVPRLETLGAIAKIADGQVFLTDASGPDVVNAGEVLLEPRQENFEAVIDLLYGVRAARVIAELRKSRANVVNADQKLSQITELLASLRDKHEVRFAGEVHATFGNFLTQKDSTFPDQIATDAPTLLFGGQGRNFATSPDEGLRKWGPYEFMQHERNEPLIAVVCEPQHRGRVEQFIQLLTSGFPDEVWHAQMAKKGATWPNPYQGGLIGKFRLSRVYAEYEETTGPAADDYERAITKLLNRLPESPVLAVVQSRDATKQLYGGQNPYFVSKAAFMTAGIPVQAVTIEKMDWAIADNPLILNNVAVATYAKLDGVPWCISMRGVTSHELVIGLGYTETRETRLGTRSRYVGLTTVFSGDGRYLVWEQTREVEFDEYAQALLETLQRTVTQIRESHRWSMGDAIRLIFHVFKPLKREEIKAIKRLVTALTEDKFAVSYAFLDLSQNHDYQLFDAQQPGKSYRSGTGSMQVRGKSVPRRGLALRIDSRTALLQLTGPDELKTDLQGSPSPLLIALHPDSDFDDLTYLVRQIFHFTFMSWRGSRPAAEPVTILYSRLIARSLANLKPIAGWNSRSLTQGGLRNRSWFL